ncbi:MAG: sugar transferase, partial [Rhodospirillales bacterium]|nr:sugar transferase [Rhodospirillales bacterium]
MLQIAGILAIAAFVTGFFGLGQLVHVSVQQKPFCGWLLAFSAFTLCGIVGARILLAATHRRLLALPRVVVVGTNDASGRLIEQLRRHKFGELNVIGRVVTDETGSDAGPGSLERLQRMVSCRELDEVLVASTITSPNDNVPVQLAGRVGSGSITLSVAADLRTRRPSEELPVVGLASPPISGAAGATKRIFDFATAAFLGAVGAPAMLLIALAIKIDSPGPVFFRQVRRGLNNEVFEILKFRTMHVQFADADASVQTRRNDQRVTRIGAVLRHHSIDEVPQLINVLRGDM